MPRPPWWLTTLAVALAARVAWVYGVDEPVTGSSSLAYATSALWIAEQPQPISFVLRNEAWRMWGSGPTGGWTLAPLYNLFAAVVFRLFGPHLRPLQLLQCVLDSGTAVAVSALGRALSPRYGTWAGLAYALYWPALTLPAHTMTENLHTPLLVAGLLALSRAKQSATAALGGFLVGLSALARAVSASFVPVVAVWQAWRRDVRLAASTLAFAALAVLPWTARNVLLTREPVLIESVSIYNLWNDNAFVDEERYANQAHAIMKQKTLAGRRAEALRFTARGLVRHPGAFATKVWEDLRYFLRPTDLHQLLVAEYPLPPWQRAGGILLGDGLFLATVPPLIALAIAGRPSATRAVILLWCAYYLFLLIVVFHVETRYRSAYIPFATAGAAGALEAVRDPERRRRALAGLAAGAVIVAAAVAPYAAPAGRAAASALALRPAADAVARGDLGAAAAAAYEAASRDRASARPWLTYGRWLARAGRAAEAVQAYQRAAERRPYVWQPILVLPRLLLESDRPDESLAALQAADALSWSVDPCLALDVAWRELPPPRTDTILLARGDYGAVRGFFRPERDHRWSRDRAWLRLVPPQPAREYDVTVEMSCPDPAPWHEPLVTLGDTPFRVQADSRPYTVRARAVDGVVLIELRAPTWSRSGRPLEQGVRVERMHVQPAA
ncbi:MAG TPA: hypothetical protein VGL15_14295 [Vicinamibacteria bacterium]